MKLDFSDRAKRQYGKLPIRIQIKAEKQFLLLLKTYRHPSLRTKKMSTGVFEGRIDYHYRFTFTVEGEIILLLTIAPHDEGLGKK